MTCLCLLIIHIMYNRPPPWCSTLQPDLDTNPKILDLEFLKLFLLPSGRETADLLVEPIYLVPDRVPQFISQSLESFLPSRQGHHHLLLRVCSLTNDQTGGPIWRFDHSLLCYLITSILLVCLFLGWNAHMTLPNVSSSMSRLIYSLCNPPPVSCAGTKTGCAFCPSSHVLLLQGLETSQNCKERMQSHANC